MKKFLTAAVVAAALLFVNHAFAATQPLTFDSRYDFAEMTSGSVAQGIVRYDIDFLALRSGPSKNYSLITRIPPGARVEIMLRVDVEGYRDYDHNFSPVTYNGMSGYAHSGYINVLYETRRDIP